MEKKNRKVIAISGGFDPVHIGHIELIRKAKALGDWLVVILNNDHWLKKKKGYTFMSERERKAILEALRDVDEVILTNHLENPADDSVCVELRRLQPSVFANGGDRKANNIPEYQLCEELGITMKFNIGGGKKQSSSWLINKVKEL